MITLDLKHLLLKELWVCYLWKNFESSVPHSAVQWRGLEVMFRRSHPVYTHSRTACTTVRWPFTQVRIQDRLFIFHKRRSTLFRIDCVSPYRSIFIWQQRIALFQLLAREYDLKFPPAQYLSIKSPSEKTVFVEYFFKAILFVSSSTYSEMFSIVQTFTKVIAFAIFIWFLL